ncbi:MAG TPA: glycosyltransferase [Methanomassiliicoccales archaeon]|nr:glycosyltransferase [Methanomassiliicoccales archaeon]
MLVSIVLKIRNEEDNIADALDSLVVQEGPIEIIVVDGNSTDDTQNIVREYGSRFPFVHLYVAGGTRGDSLNFGLSKATADIIALTDGDCIANPNWVKEIRHCVVDRGADMVAGKSINIGLNAWEKLDRVELYNKGFDCTWPGCNLAFRRKVFETVGGVDPWFITAEDIDFNIRATNAGFNLVYNPKAIIYNRTRGTVYGFFNQAFWNGAGRKQLTLKHGSLWTKYDPLRMFRQHMTFWALMRLVCAWMGYLAFKLFGELHPNSKA